MTTHDQRLNQNLLIQIANSIPDYKCKLLLTYLGIYYGNPEPEKHLGDKFTKDGNTDCIGGLEFWNNNILPKLLKNKAENEKDPLVKGILEKGLQIGGPDKAETLRAQIASLPQNEMFSLDTDEHKNKSPVLQHDNQEPEFHNSLDNLPPVHINNEDPSYIDTSSSNRHFSGNLDKDQKGHFDMPIPNTLHAHPPTVGVQRPENTEQHTFEEMLGEFDYLAQKEKDFQYEEEFSRNHQHINQEYEDLTLSEVAKQDESEPSLIIYIVIGIGCLTVLIALIYLIVYCCRKKRSSNVENQDRQRLLRQINDDENSRAVNSVRVKKYNNKNRERK